MSAASSHVSRRGLLKALGAAGVAAAATGSLVQGRAFAQTTTATVPTVDRLTVEVVLDNVQDIFLPAGTIQGVQVQRARAPANFKRILQNYFGLSLHLASQRGDETRRVLLDFGYTPDGLLNNVELLGLEVGKLDALVLSHGHFDHFGGLVGFLDRHRATMRPDLKLFAGGEDVFCHRYWARPTAVGGGYADFGVLDRRELRERNVEVVLATEPTAVADHAFTTGVIPRRSFERVLPNTQTSYTRDPDGSGCDAAAYVPADLVGKIGPDENWHEHATCYHVRGRGLVVISSCGHTGVINAIRRAQDISGVSKLHALVGGIHLGPAPQPYIAQTVAALKEIDPDVVIPMHCSGVNFVNAMRAEMPDKLILSSTGTRYTFAV